MGSQPIDHLAALRHEGAAYADVLAHAALSGEAGLASPVQCCGDWTLRDLTEHLGAVHRWAARAVRTGERLGDTDPLPVMDAAELLEWFRTGVADLVRDLADPDQPCRTLVGAGTAAWWQRRQALETAVHRLDAQRAVGAAATINPALAADGVGEVLDVMFPRQVRLERAQMPTHGLELVADDVQQRWQLGSGDVVATVSGSAQELLLLLWRRMSVGDAALSIDGDPAEAAAVLDRQLTP